MSMRTTKSITVFPNLRPDHHDDDNILLFPIMSYLIKSMIEAKLKQTKFA